ncbi:MAG: 2-amino-4-hydroxy-6-hydroxymethyldihydropteridine diphosphokinase [Planctomycetota bacterium]
MKPQSAPTRAFLSIGSNLADRKANLERAVALLKAHPAIRVLRVSSFHETKPWGVTDQPDFLNAAVEIETTLDPHELLDALQATEKNMGRRPAERWGPRLIDLDILLFGDAVIESDRLTVPHPRLDARAFALAPLAEIAPQVRHPGTGATVRSMLEKLPPER